MLPSIYTSCWRTKIDPMRFARIGISRGTPRQAGFRRYLPLQPGQWWRDVTDEVEWCAAYDRLILAPLDPRRVVAELQALADGRPAVLLCWEPPPPDLSFCHCALVSRWLHKELNIEVRELGYEAAGFGCQHPKLPSQA